MSKQKTQKPKGKTPTKSKEDEVSRGNLFLIPVSKLEVEPGFNQRIDYGSDEDFQEFMDNIKENGIINPIRVIPHPTKKGMFYIREGHRRMKAIELLEKAGVKMGKIKAMIASKETFEESLFKMASANNGKPFTPIELGLVCIVLMDRGFSVKEIASKLGIPEAKIYNYISLAKVPKKFHGPIAKGEISHVVISSLVRECDGDFSKVEKLIEDASKRAAKEAKRKGEDKPKKVTAKHVKGVQSIKNPMHIFREIITQAEKDKTLFSPQKILVASTLYELLDNKGTVKEGLEILKK